MLSLEGQEWKYRVAEYSEIPSLLNSCEQGKEALCLCQKSDQQSQELSNALLCVQAMPTEPFPTSDPEIQGCQPVFYERKLLTQLCRNCS